MFTTYPDIVTPDQISTMLGIGKSSVYDLLKTKQLQHVRVGKKYIVPKQSVVDFACGNCYNETKTISGRLRPSVMSGKENQL